MSTTLNTFRQNISKRKKTLQISLYFSIISFTKTQNIQERKYMCTRKIEALSRNQYFCAKARSITYSEYAFVALFIPHAKCIRRIILSALACITVPYFSTLSQKINDSRKRKAVELKSILVFSAAVCLKHSWSKGELSALS